MVKKNKGTKAFQKLEAEYAYHLFGRVQCVECRHQNEGPTCTAFPDGIPKTLIDDIYDHRTPYPGDNGIMFEPIKKQ